ncbi:hypothetical protein [Microbacterium immunditiarum]|uniref:Uncharacterized protein n=1 Tax=Microbacterium immunditiarum TaxID=337480 RepID=A0A7Y9GMY3_9MICO|nr:hypothetical protein [Microbacterium immunditiarum]NYE19453.1 hypothetical protein [Microbacterium immunditiarum]
MRTRITTTGVLPRDQWDAFQKRAARYQRSALRDFHVRVGRYIRQNVDGERLHFSVVYELEGEWRLYDIEQDIDNVVGRATVELGGRVDPATSELVGD